MRFLFIFTLLFCFSAKAEIDPTVVAFCTNASNFAAIGGSMPNLFYGVSPAPPFGGVSVGLIQNSNALLDFCDFVMSFQEWNNTQKLFGAKNFVNKLTGQKFDEDFTMVDKTFNILNNFYDFESGESRPGGMSGASNQRDMNEYIRDLNVYIANKQMDASERRAAEANYQSEGQIFAQIAAKNANLKASMNCPAPDDGKNYGDLYAKNVTPEERIKERAADDELFFRSQLTKLGQLMFKGDAASYDMYSQKVKQLSDWGVTLNKEDLTYQEETSKPSTRKDAEGHVVQKKTILKKQYQNYTVRLNNEVFDKFKQEYSDRWSSAVRMEYLTNTTQFGLFGGAGRRVENSFRDLSYECREQRIMVGYDIEKTKDYSVIYEKKRQQCIDNLQVDQKEIENLLSYYLVNYQNSAYQLKKSTAKIWTFESRYMNINRATSKTNNFQEEDVKCSDHLSVAQMQALSLKQEAAHNEMKEMIFKNNDKKINMKIIEKERQAKQNKAQQMQIEQMEAKNKVNIRKQSSSPNITPIGGGIGAKNIKGSVQP